MAEPDQASAERDGPSSASTKGSSPPTPAQPPSRLLVLEVDWPSLFGLLAAAAFVALAASIWRLAPDAVSKVAVGLVLGLALDPVVRQAARRLGIARGPAVAIVSAGLATMFAGVLLVLGPAAIREAGNIRTQLPATIEEAYSWPAVGPRLEQADAAAEVDSWIDSLPAQLDDDRLAQIARGALGGLVTFLIIGVTAMAVLIDGDVMVRRVRGIVPVSDRNRLDEVGRAVYRTFANYFAGSLLVASLNGLVMMSVALALGVPLAPLIGLWAALTNLIPQIGGFLGGSFLVVLALTEGAGPALVALVVFVVYQNVENNLIQPAVVGTAVNLSPPVTMLAALMGGAVAGVPGALVATPIVGTVKVLFAGVPGPTPPRASMWRRLSRRIRAASP